MNRLEKYKSRLEFEAGFLFGKVCGIIKQKDEIVRFLLYLKKECFGSL